MVNRILLTPQEIETFYVLPSIRRYLAQELKKSMNQTQIATLMQINKSAISQYLNTKRGDKITFNEPILKEIKKTAKKINSQMTYLTQIQNILKFIRENHYLCAIHRQINPMPKSCCPKMMGCDKL